MTIESLTDALETAFRYKYCDFKTRTCVAHFWYVILFDVILFVPTLILCIDNTRQGAILGVIEAAVLACPTLAAIVRRYHDAGRSGKSAAKLLGGFLLSLITTALLYDGENINLSDGGTHYLLVISACFLAGLGMWLFFTLSLPTYPGETQWNSDDDEMSYHIRQEEVRK